MSVTLSQVKRAARAHRAPLAGESAGYLVLAIADQVLQAPRLVQAADVQLTEDGALRVVSGHASSDADAELSLRRALDQLLLVASSGSAALTRASRRTVPVGLSALVRELEAALIPVNRSAARRALARVHRETTRALDSGSLPEEEEAQAPEPVAAPAPVVVAAPAPVVAAAPEPVVAAAPEPVVAAAPAPVVAAAPAPVVAAAPAPVVAAPVVAAGADLDLEQELETPARVVPVAPVPSPILVDSHLDGVVSALCEQLPAAPQFVESDALTSALAVRELPVPAAPASLASEEPELLLDIDVEYDTDAVDSSAAPTVMRAVDVAPVALSAQGASDTSDPPALDLPLEARTRPEPVVLRKTLRPLLDLLPSPMPVHESEPLPKTPTLGTLATELPVLKPEQIAELSVAASLAAELLQISLERDDHTIRMPEVLPLAPGVAMVETKKSDVNELLSSFQVAEPDVNPGLCRAIKEMAELDLTPAPFAALIR